MDYGQLFGNLGTTVAGGVLNNWLNSGASSAGQQGYNASVYKPTDFNSSYGNMWNSPNGMNYNLNPEQLNQLRMFQGMSTQAGGLAAGQGAQVPGAGSYFSNLGAGYAGGAAGYGNPYHQAGLDTLGAYSAFDPQNYAETAYRRMSALAAPQNTSDTQNMFSHLASTGRLGLNQNGVLGDAGGLALAQATADNQRRMEAETYGLNAQDQLAKEANNFGTTGSAMTTQMGQVGNMFANMGNTQANSAVSRYGDLSGTAGTDVTSGNNINAPMMDQARMALMRSQGEAYAGANAGGFLSAAQNNVNANNQNYAQGVMQTASPYINTAAGKAGDYLSSMFGGGGAAGAGAAGSSAAGASIAGGDAAALGAADGSAFAAAPGFTMAGAVPGAATGTGIGAGAAGTAAVDGSGIGLTTGAGAALGIGAGIGALAYGAYKLGDSYNWWGNNNPSRIGASNVPTGAQQWTGTNGRDNIIGVPAPSGGAMLAMQVNHGSAPGDPVLYPQGGNAHTGVGGWELKGFRQGQDSVLTNQATGQTMSINDPNFQKTFGISASDFMAMYKKATSSYVQGH